MTTKPAKPLGRKAYGSIGHLPNSRLGPTDSCVTPGMARICTERARDRHDTIVVQEKLDGSCTAVAIVNGELHALGRAGWPARTSRFEMHHLFAEWVDANADRFRSVLSEGERMVGEWLAQAHGTIYDLDGWMPWAPFDIMTGSKRETYHRFIERVAGVFEPPELLHIGTPLPVSEAMRIHEWSHGRPCDEPEGVMYRVERHGKVDFLAKWVRPDKQDGRYLPEIGGGEPVWNWRPEDT